MINIKTYKDGARFVLVVENCTGETARKVNHFLASLMELPDEASIPVSDVPSLEPVKVAKEKEPDINVLQEIPAGTVKAFEEPMTEQEVNEAVMQSGPYKGYTPAEAFRQDGVKAAVMLYASRDIAVTSNAREGFSALCMEEMHKDLTLRQMQMFTKEDFANFLSIYHPLIADGLEQILQTSGFNGVQDFLEFASDTVLEEAQNALIDSILTYCR